MFLKIKKYNGYDDMFYPLKNVEGTWGEVLEHIEQVLDDKYIDNHDKLVGINLELEIVEDAPNDCIEQEG